MKMFVSRFAARAVLVSAAVILLFAATVVGGFHKPGGQLWSGQCDLRDGDLVFVRGRSLRSCLVRMIGAPSDFSHVGIVVTEDGKPGVLHAKPNAKTLQIENIDDFLSPSRVDYAGIYRLKGQACIGYAASREALKYFERGVPFDDKFDISNDEKLYCTELVWKAYEHVGIDLCRGDRDFLYDSAVYGKVLLPFRLSESTDLFRATEMRLF